MNVWIGIVLCVAEGYLLGSLNFSIIVSKVLKGEDIRNFGSKNAGMTNILRTYGKRYALLCGLGDFIKGVLAVLLGRLIFSALDIALLDAGFIAGTAVVLGHLLPLYFGFRGGKGVLTGLGVILTLNPAVFSLVLVVVLPILFKTRIVSLASVLGAVLYPILTLVWGLFLRRETLWIDSLFALLCGLLVLYMHRANIKRLLNGTEYRFGEKKT